MKSILATQPSWAPTGCRSARLRVAPGCTLRTPLPLARRVPRTILTPPCAKIREGLESAQKGVKKQFELETNRLESGLRDKVEDAVEDLGYRVTVGDVAAKAGVKVSDAERALQALAADTQGTLQVSDEGTIVYDLDRDFRGRLQSASFRRKVEPVLRGIGQWGYWALRVSFGIALVTTVALVWIAIIVALSSGKDEDRRETSSGNGNSMYYGARMMGDAFYYFDPYYYSSYRVVEGGDERGDQQMGFVEAIFSCVFGDGDINADFDERRWAALGRAIAAKRGVMTAEEIGGFLDIDEDRATAIRGQIDATYQDESYVLPALLRFGGSPQTDAEGNLVYVFPSLQTSAIGASEASRGGVARFATEDEQPFSAATKGQKIGVGVLAALLAVGVGILSNMVATSPAVFMTSGLAWVFKALPAFQAFASGVILIPLARWFVNSNKNAAIETRNLARQEVASLAGTSTGRRKRAAADALAASEYSVVREADITFRSDRDVGEQSDEAAARDFERRLSQRETDGSRDRTGGW